MQEGVRFCEVFVSTEKSILDRFIYSGHSRQPLSKDKIALASAHLIKFKKGERLRKTDQSAEPGPKPTVGPARVETDGQRARHQEPNTAERPRRGGGTPRKPSPKYSTPKRPTFDPGTGGDLHPGASECLPVRPTPKNLGLTKIHVRVRLIRGIVVWGGKSKANNFRSANIRKTSGRS